jgi:hypothetical protein
MIVATFRSPEDARAAIEALEHHGIDGVEIGVPRPASDDRPPSVDRRTLLHVGGRAGKGIAAGIVVGAGSFAAAGVVLLVIGLPAGAFVGMVLAGAAIGGTAGAFIGVERGVGMSESWEHTFHEPRGHTVPVEVHTTSASETSTARQVFEEHRPVALYESSGVGR